MQKKRVKSLNWSLKCELLQSSNTVSQEAFRVGKRTVGRP